MPSRHVVSVVLSADELELLDSARATAAGTLSKSAFIRHATIALAEKLVGEGE